MSFYYPFRLSTLLMALAIAGLMLLSQASVSPLHAQTAQPAQQVAQQAALSDAAKARAGSEKKAEPEKKAGPASKDEVAKPKGEGNVAAVDPAKPAQQKGIAGKTIDKVKEVAKSAGDIFSRVPCLAPKGGSKSMGSLPHVASKLASGQPVVIVAFGSSSTAGFGATSPEFNYPNRLAAQLRRQYPTADITVINRGKGGDDAPEMMKRLQTEVIDMHPDLVIWQVGTNAVLRNLDPAETAKLVEEGVTLIQAAGADLVLVDPQYSPAVNAKAENAGKMVKLLGRVAELRRVGVFPRFEVMKDWHEKQAIPIENFVIADGLHMNDWGYACFAQLLGDDIIKSVGQIKLGINVPSDVRAYRPM
jgi:lysophospholipase L1-like esterase